MTPEAFKAAGEALYGPRWIADMARSLHCSTRSVRRWAAGSWPVPDGVEHDVALMLATRQAALAEMTKGRRKVKAPAPTAWKAPPAATVPMAEGGVCYPPFGAEPQAMVAAPTVKAPAVSRPPRWMIDEERAKLEREGR